MQAILVVALLTATSSCGVLGQDLFGSLLTGSRRGGGLLGLLNDPWIGSQQNGWPVQNVKTRYSRLGHRSQKQQPNQGHIPLDQLISNQQPSDQLISNQQPSDQLISNQQPSDQLISNQQPSDQLISNQQPSDQHISNQQSSDQLISNEQPSDQLNSNQQPSDQLISNEQLSVRSRHRQSDYLRSEPLRLVEDEQDVEGPFHLGPGDSCERDNRNGICTRIFDCQEVIQSMHQGGELPSPCYESPIDSVLYVCCFDEAEVNPPAPVPLPRSQGEERLANKKCREYAELVYSTRESLALFGDSLIKEDHCATSAESLIVGGVEAIAGEFPHMALLGYGDSPDSLSWDCGGSLISENFVLTAAHCVVERSPSYVLLGEHALDDDDDNAHPQLVATEDIIMHPEYKYPSNYYDVTLIRLARPARLGPNIRPACLHTGRPYIQGSLVASGWGLLDFAGDTSNVLMKVKLNEIEFEICNKTYHNLGHKLINGIKDDQQICAGRLEGGKDTCQGDSGGPLQVFRSDPYCTYDIVGVVSFGKGCALKNTPAVYARVQYFLDWIEQTVWPGNSD